jgi:succinate dehydrogenase/fumarate reductase flavoprotein subunit
MAANVTTWHKEVDVIVVGYGAAGGISAITAHDAGAKVLLIEKMPHPGGISMLSGGTACAARLYAVARSQ